MDAVHGLTGRWAARLLLFVGLIGGSTHAQNYGAMPPPYAPSTVGSPAGAPRYVSPYGAGVRRVQALPEDSSLGGGLPGGTEGVAPPFPEGNGEPVPNTTDLSAPAAERAFGGGEPTEELAQEEAAGEEEEDSTLLMQALGMEDSRIKLYGWIQNSFTGNPSQPSDHINFGVTPNYKANEWMGNQYYLVVEDPLELDDTFNVGFRVDNLFGHDWQFNKMLGVFDDAFNNGQFTGFDLAQFYGEAHLPVLTEGGLDVKFGRWYTLHGYEVVPAIGRPLLSVPYMFTFGQPFTHWGAMTTLHVNDKLNLYNGTTNGWDRFQNANYKWGYMGGFSWTFGEEDKGNLTTIWSFGPNQFPNFLGETTSITPTGSTPVPFLAGRKNLGYANNYRTLFTTVLSWQWTDKLTQVVESDQAFENNVPGIGPGGTSQNAEWYSFGNWFLYDFFENDKLVGVWRSEVFRDDDGVRTGFATNFAEMTLGLIYKPQPWLWFRPEARYDWARNAKPYNGGVSGSQFTLGFDVIFLF